MMEKEMILYAVKNEINGEVYVGATTSSLNQRKLDHLERAVRGESNKFHNAICTYGADTFKWEQIDTASNVDELAQKEKKYIYEYASKENGYNSDEGGGFKKSVYQYDLDNGELIQKYNSLQEATEAINSTKQHISRACLSVNKVYGGFYWSYELKDNFKPDIDLRKKTVLQFTVDGDLISEFNSVSEASKITGISKTCISRCCRGERPKTSGFIFKYA